jgi:hypothetical protein
MAKFCHWIILSPLNKRFITPTRWWHLAKLEHPNLVLVDPGQVLDELEHVPLWTRWHPEVAVVVHDRSDQVEVTIPVL